MKVHKLLSCRDIDIFHPNSHLEGCTEALKLFLFAFWQGTLGEKLMYLLHLCFPGGQIALFSFLKSLYNSFLATCLNGPVQGTPLQHSHTNLHQEHQ